METSFNAQQGSRPLNARMVSQRLRSAIIPEVGPNRLTLVGAGNPHTRENGTQVRIFNVQAFESEQKADEAGKLFLQGLEAERAGDINAAQPFYKQALNCLMNFSVLETNADRFKNTLEVQCSVEWGQNRQGQQMLQINRVSPVETKQAGQTMGRRFDLPADMLNSQAPAAPAQNIQGVMNQPAQAPAATAPVTVGAPEGEQSAPAQTPSQDLSTLPDAGIISAVDENESPI